MTATVTTLLTARQKLILSAIRAFADENGYPPTLREIGAAVGLYPSAVQYQLERLQLAGWITRHPNRPRSIVVLNPDTGGQ